MPFFLEIQIYGCWLAVAFSRFALRPAANILHRSCLQRYDKRTS